MQLLWQSTKRTHRHLTHPFCTAQIALTTKKWHTISESIGISLYIYIFSGSKCILWTENTLPVLHWKLARYHTTHIYIYIYISLIAAAAPKCINAGCGAVYRFGDPYGALMRWKCVCCICIKVHNFAIVFCWSLKLQLVDGGGYK